MSDKTREVLTRAGGDAPVLGSTVPAAVDIFVVGRSAETPILDFPPSNAGEIEILSPTTGVNVLTPVDVTASDIIVSTTKPIPPPWASPPAAGQDILVTAPTPGMALLQAGEFPPADVSENLVNVIVSLVEGAWLPNIDPILIGSKNFKSMENLRYQIAAPPEGVSGYTKINTTPITTYIKLRSGIQLQSSRTIKSYVLVQAENTGLTESVVVQNQTAIPGQGNFKGTVLLTDASGAGLGRFSDGPAENVLYANGKESCIWAGEEMRVAAFFVVDDANLSNPLDSTVAANNELQTEGNVISVGNDIDAETVVLLHMDGADASTTFTDSSTTPHTFTAQGDAQLDTAKIKFGTASGLFDGTGDYIDTPDHADFYMGTSDFTIDFWINFNSLSSDIGLFHQKIDVNNYATGWLDVFGGTITLRVKIVKGGVTQLDYSGGPISVNINTMYHLAIIRGGWSGADALTCHLDGIIFFPDPGTEDFLDDKDWPDLTGNFEIMRSEVPGPTITLHNGWLDEFRLSKGIARWTTSFFAPPTRQYTTGKDSWVVMSTRPLQGVKYYVSEPNSTTSTTTGKTWTGQEFSSLTVTDGTASGGVSLAQSGVMSFASTVGQAVPYYFEGLYLYAYLFNLSAGSAEIYNVTADADFQEVVDIWDGILRQPIVWQFWDDSADTGAGTYTEYTLEVNASSIVDYRIGGQADGMTTSDKIIMMFDDRMAAIKYEMIEGFVNIASAVAVLKYWNGSAYIEVGNLVDGTTEDGGATKTLNQSGVMSWTPPSGAQEKPQTLFGVTGYAYELTITGGPLSGTTGDSSAEVVIDVCTGIPAQLVVPPFKFPSQFKSRALLCGYTEGKEGNRVDFCFPNAPDVWNGGFTSHNGFSSLFFGGNEDLTAGTQLHLRLSSRLLTVWLALKDSESYMLAGSGPSDYQIFPISQVVGTPAPLTLAKAEAGPELSKDTGRNVAFWLSNTGPIMFDGVTPHPIPGIENYFDQTNAESIDFDNIGISRGWYDSNFKEYNLLIPSGSSQTTNNVWLVLDVTSMRWSKKVPPAFPQMGFQVIDTNGERHLYGGIDTGYMMRLENGSDWDGTDIDQVLESGDFFPTGDPWDITLVRSVKVFATKISEASRDLSITHYADTDNSASTSLASLDLDDSTQGRIVRDTQYTNLTAWTHRFKFSASMSATPRGLQLQGWGYQFRKVRIDEKGA